MNDIPKVAFSKTLQSADWPESRIAGGDTVEEIARLRAEPGGEIVAHGGVRFAQSLARLGVVDEYRLYVYPIAVGTGRSLFAVRCSPESKVFNRYLCCQTGVSVWCGRVGLPAV